MDNNESNHKVIGSVKRAMDILDFLYLKDAGQSATEIARELNISVGAAHHLLYTLKQYQFVEQDSLTKKYHLGIRLAVMGDRVKSHNYLIELCSPYLRKLMESTGETANLSVLKDGQIMYIAQVESNKLIRMFTQLGACVDAHCSGAGKVLLSGLKDEDIAGIIESRGLKRYTKNTITNKYELISEINAVRTAGYAVDSEEREEGVMCIAAPVIDYKECTVASVSISGPASRFKEKQKEYIRCVVGVGVEISNVLHHGVA